MEEDPFMEQGIPMEEGPFIENDELMEEVMIG